MIWDFIFDNWREEGPSLFIYLNLVPEVGHEMSSIFLYQLVWQNSTEHNFSEFAMSDLLESDLDIFSNCFWNRSLGSVRMIILSVELSLLTTWNSILLFCSSTTAGFKMVRWLQHIFINPSILFLGKEPSGLPRKCFWSAVPPRHQSFYFFWHRGEHLALPRLVSSRQREVVRCRMGMTASLLWPSVLRNANKSGQPNIYI